MGKELKIAHFVIGFAFMCLSFFIELKKNKSYKYQFIYSLLLLIIIISVFITGERANFIRGLLLTLILINFINNNYLSKIIITFSLIFLISISIISFERIENRFNNQVTKNIYDKGFIKYFKESQHGAHFDVAMQIFKKYPFFGIGNKNFQIECQKEEYYNLSYKLSSTRCSTHPHQVYYELLSEHGIFGTFVIISIIFYIIYKNFTIYNRKKNVIHLTSILFTVVTFLPIIPSGSFFVSFGATIFWINFATMCYFYIKFNKKNR
jgi:O-antigen ligase